MFDIIEQAIASHFGLTREELLTERHRNASDARHFLWHILHSTMGYSSRAISRHYGVSERNIFYYSSAIRAWIKHQPYYAEHFAQIRSELKMSDII